MALPLLDIPVIFGVSIEVCLICLIIGLTIFFVGKWLFRKFSKNEKIPIVKVLILAFVATPIIYFGLIWLLILWITYTPYKDFEKSQWLTDKRDRFQMADDIIKNKMLINRDTAEVKQLLGEPTRRQPTIAAWTYDMGMGGGGLGFMFHNLFVKFDKGKVVAVEHAKFSD